MKKIIYLLCFLVAFLAICLGLSLYHLCKVNSVLDSSRNGAIVETGFVNSHKKETKNILFVGNSITWHPVSGYWFGAWGMAATSKDKDYVHVLVKKLSKKYNIKFQVCTYSSWEANAHDRGEFLPMLDKAFSVKNDYIIFQLGENANDITTYYEDFSDLVKYAKSKNPNAKFIVMGNFYFNSSEQKEIAKIKVCEREGATYIDLNDINAHEYYFGKGHRLYGEDKKLHDITLKGVWVHPNNKAMNVYADRIYDAIMEK